VYKRQGSAGTSGTSGVNGTSGTSGNTGDNGSSGTSGVNGANGSSGTSGNTGANGSSGTSGVNGANGSSGTSGNTGANGSSGTSGNTGVDGTSGTSGSSGTSGGGSSLTQGFTNTKYYQQVSTAIFQPGYNKVFGKFTYTTNISTSINLSPREANALAITLDSGTFFNTIYFWNRTALSAGSSFKVALFDSKIVNSGGVSYVAPGNILINFNTDSIDLTTTGLKSITGYNTTIPNSSVNGIYFLAVLYVPGSGTTLMTITGASPDSGIFRISTANNFSAYPSIQALNQTALTSNMSFPDTWINNTYPVIGYSAV
jgi:hypothetical protein